MSFLRNISVEPPMFLFMFAFMITNVIEQEFFFQKACRVNHNFTDKVCANISSYPAQERIVQVTTAKFYQYEDITAQFFPIVLALFLGEWSDKYGRKIPLILGLSGKLLYSLMIVVNALYDWNLEYVLLTATLPASITGSDMAIFASCFAYISDITTGKNRTFRIGILDATYLCAMPLGVACGSYIFNHIVHKSFAIMFSINACFVTMAIIYSVFMLKVATLEKQIENHRLASLKTKFTDFFSVDWHNMLAIFKIGPSTCSGSEAAECLNNRRISKDVYKRSRYYIMLILLAMFFFTFQREEKSYMFLYTKSKFHWQEQNFSIFRVIRSSCYAFSLMVLLPVLTKLFKFGDFTISYAGCMAHIISHLGFYFAESEVVFLMCAILGSLGVVVGPLIRSMASKIVVETQRGKMFALLSVCDNAVPFISTFAYSNIYRYTLGTSHSGVFILTVVTQMTVLTLLSTILILNRSQILKPPTEQMNLLQCSDSFWISGTGSDGASQANTASATTTINTNTLPQANAIHMNTLKRKHNTSSRTEKNTRNASSHPVNEIKANILEAIMVM